MPTPQLAMISDFISFEEMKKYFLGGNQYEL